MGPYKMKSWQSCKDMLSMWLHVIILGQDTVQEIERSYGIGDICFWHFKCKVKDLVTAVADLSTVL